MRFSRFILVVSIAVVGLRSVKADTPHISVEVLPENVGLNGVVRPGQWTPMLIQVENKLSKARQVRCQWVVSDADGDRVDSQRLVVLNPDRVNRVWLYAKLPAATDLKASWRINVIDGNSGATLATQEVRAAEIIPAHTRVIGVTSSQSLGLDRYAHPVTQHEECRVIRGVNPMDLPDRWHGLSLMQALIWTADGGDPGSTPISVETIRAIKNWVKRGGHLVVSFGGVGEAWFESSLRDMLPPVSVKRSYGVKVPQWLGNPDAGTSVPPIDVKFFEVLTADAHKVSVLLRDAEDRALVVAANFGFGCVTLIGVDLADPVIKMIKPPQENGLWSQVFHWQTPAYSKSYLDQALQQRRMLAPQYRQKVKLDRFIPRIIAMHGTATSALLAAMILFGLYWLVAGPVSVAVLKRRDQLQHSWMVFLGVICVASVCAWGGAWTMRPLKTSISHFTVLDFDARSSYVHGQSWMSVLVPKHKNVEVAIGAQNVDLGTSVLSSPGTHHGGREGGFVDRRVYEINGVSPSQVIVPIRATAKQFEIDYLGRSISSGHGVGTNTSVMRIEELHMKAEWPTGKLVHNFPGTLNNVLVVYCAGDGQIPVVWRLDTPWLPGGEMMLHPSETPQPLVQPYRYDREGVRLWKSEGYLGRLMAFKTGQNWGGQEPVGAILADSEIVQAVEMLSFFDMLPPPDFLNTKFASRVVNYGRRFGRALDLTQLVALRCLIVIGHLNDSPMLLPVTVDGTVVSSSGRTVVRWVCPLERN